MPRRCTACTHPKRPAIDRALVARSETMLQVAKRYGLTSSSVYRHYDEHIPETLAAAQAVRDAADAGDLYAELARCLERVNLLFDACDRWLRDADDASRYDLGPRAEDVAVTYRTAGANGRPVQKKAKLSELLRRAERAARARKAPIDVEVVEVKHADPRELILKTADRLHVHAELLAKLLGKLQPGATVNVLVASPEWQRVQAALVAALAPFPEARQRVAAALAAMSASAPSPIGEASSRALQ